MWVMLLVGGWYALLRYEFTPGSRGQVFAQWPAGSGLPRDFERPTLVLFAHRSCPCTRTVLQELENLLMKDEGRARVLVVLVAPEEAATDRVGGEIEKRARALREAQVVADPDGQEARRFHVRTSGHVLLYDAQGQLLFSGGITAARGHAGDSVGRQAVLAWLENNEGGQRSAPVYGCSLFAEDGEADEEASSWNP